MGPMRAVWLEMKGLLWLARRIINAKLKPLGLSSLEGDILYHLLGDGTEYRQEQLAKLLDIGKAAVSRAVDSLESKGFVTRRRRSGDKRSCRLSATEKALALGPEIENVYGGLYVRAMKGIADEDFIRVKSLIARITANLLETTNAS